MRGFTLGRALPTLYFILFFALSSLAAFPDQSENCALPAPGTVSATPSSGSSMTVSWAAVPSSNTTATWYRLDVNDLTAPSSTLPSVYTTNLSYDYPGLPEGHCFRFSVSATACGNNWNETGSGPGESGIFGPPVSTTACLGFILVIDDVAQLNGNFMSPVYYTGNSVTIDLPYGVSGNRGLLKKVTVRPSPNSSTYAQFFLFANVNSEPQTKHLGATTGISRNPVVPQNLLETFNVEYKFVSGTFFNMSSTQSDDNSVPVTIQFPAGVSGYVSVATEIMDLDPGGGKNEMARLVNNGFVENGARFNDRSFENTHSILEIYPNPANQQVRVALQLQDAANSSLTLYNTHGQAVRQPLLRGTLNTPGRFNFIIPLDGLQPGLYQLVLDSAEGRQYKTLLKL
jgi:hypothetical protein